MTKLYLMDRHTAQTLAMQYEDLPAPHRTEDGRRAAEKRGQQRRAMCVLADRLWCAALMRDANGAPYLVDGQPVSISFADGWSVLATADVAVGVDIEGMRSEQAHSAALDRRFLSELPPVQKAEGTVELYRVVAEKANITLQKEKFSLVEEEEHLSGTDRFLVRWTRAEAVLKLYGRGFKSHSRLGTKAAGARLLTLHAVNARLVLSVAAAR